MSKNYKLIAKIIVFIWPLLGLVLSFVLQANFFLSIFIFFGVPSFLLSLINPRSIKRAALFSLISAPITLIMDYVMEVTGGWVIPNSIFGSYRLLGQVTIDIFFWGYLYLFFIVMFYETFLEHHYTSAIGARKLKYFFLILFFVSGAFFIAYLTKPELLNIRHFYAYVGFISGIGMIIFSMLKFPRIIAKTLKAGIYFFFLSLSYETTALTLNQWTFPNNSQSLKLIGLGNFKLPAEEIGFWIILGAIIILAYYEFYDDDMK